LSLILEVRGDAVYVAAATSVHPATGPLASAGLDEPSGEFSTAHVWLA
jgi:hypothetical protein